MTTWIDYAVGTLITVIGLFILYRALKEPMDLLFGVIGKGLLQVKDWLSGGPQENYEVISYG